MKFSAHLLFFCKGEGRKRLCCGLGASLCAGEFLAFFAMKGQKVIHDAFEESGSEWEKNASNVVVHQAAYLFRHVHVSITSRASRANEITFLRQTLN